MSNGEAVVVDTGRHVFLSYQLSSSEVSATKVDITWVVDGLLGTRHKRKVK